MATPLYDRLQNFAEEKPLRFHIPGHKGKEIPFLEDMVAVDFTELSRTGNLYEEGEPFDEAHALWAMEFGFPHSQFLTGGSTQGVTTALALCAKEGDQILLDRTAHKSAFNAMGLLGLDPVYLLRPWIDEFQVLSAVDPEEVDRLMSANPELKTVFITSPTVNGVLSDVYSIAEIVHDHGGKLIVDGAHGAHLPWLMIDNFSAADVVTISPHKTLPCLGQAAILLYRDFSPMMVRETASLFGTSSPSYLIMSSMDLAREWMCGDGMMEYVRVARQVATLREILPSLKEPLLLDPLRLCLVCNQGIQVAEALEKQNIFLEMATPAHLVAVFSGLDYDSDIQTLAKALVPHFARRSPLPDISPPMTLPIQKMAIRDVIFSEKITIPWSQSVGKVAGVNIAPFPPGIPIVAMGEEITQVEWDYLQRICYEKEEILVVT